VETVHVETVRMMWLIGSTFHFSLKLDISYNLKLKLLLDMGVVTEAALPGPSLKGEIGSRLFRTNEVYGED